jgi:hypothetical protein
MERGMEDEQAGAVIGRYEPLIEGFVRGRIPVREFQERYVDAWLAEPGGKGERLYDILQDLFGAAETYWPEATPETESWYRTSEETLRKDAAATLERLRALRARVPE